MRLPMRFIFIFLSLLLMPSVMQAQDYSGQLKTYFMGYLKGSALLDMGMKSLPTLEDCKLVFKDEDAATYFKYVEEMRKKTGAETAKDTSVFVDVRIESFTSGDLVNGKGNFAGGMKNCADKIKPNCVFYEVNMLRTVGAEAGVSYKYWVNINGRWVFFPKPWRAFETK